MSGPNAAGRRPSPGVARRWPDLMIGVLVLLLLGGFGALLLRDNGPAATVTAATETESATPVAEAEIPAAPGTEGVTVTPPGEPTEAATTPTTPAAPTEPEPGAATTAQAPAPPVSGNTAPAEVEAPVTDAQPSTDPVAAAPLKPAPAPAEPEKSEVPSAATLPEQPAAPVTPPASLATGTPDTGTSTNGTVPTTAVPGTAPGAVPAAEQRTPLRSDYRISLGSFTSEQTVRSQTAGVSGLGYTVHPIDLGGQFVAQVGPYADEATARRALADIRRAFPSAVLYPPRGVSLKGERAPAAPTSITQTPAAQTPVPAGQAPVPAGQTSASQVPASQAPAIQPPAPVPDNAATTAPAPPLPVPTSPAAAATPAASGSTYLQVGAFDRIESAQTLVEQLRGEGFSPSVNAPEGRKVTVLVGPFSGAALTDAESKLSSAGHDFFQVR